MPRGRPRGLDIVLFPDGGGEGGRNRPRRYSGRALGLSGAEGLAHSVHQFVKLTGLCGREQRVQKRRQLVLGRDGDTGFALLELDGLGTVKDRHHERSGGVRAPPRPDALFLFGLAAVVALAGPALHGADVGGVAQEQTLLLQAADQLGAADRDGIVTTGGNGGEC